MTLIANRPASGVAPSYENSRAIVVIDDLAALSAPTTGVISLPLALDWTPANVYDLGDARREQTLYATVLQEAHTEQDLRDYLNYERLTDIWTQLRLPRRIRNAWETQHQELARAH